MEKLIAHSADEFVGKQLYEDHIHGVYDRAVKHLEYVLKYCENESLKEVLTEILKAAAVYHDFGKLDEISQQLLHGAIKFSKNVKMINHTDAGACILINFAREFAGKEDYDNMFKCLMSAILVTGHHIGMLQPERQSKRGITKADIFNNFTILRDKQRVLDRCPNYKNDVVNEYETVMSYNDKRIAQWEKGHNDCIDREYGFGESKLGPDGIVPLMIRLVLSCLVEGDHYDTTVHYSGRVVEDQVELKPALRLKALRSHVETLGKKKVKSKKEIKRNEIRKSLFNDCLKVPLTKSSYFNDGLVGTAKTYSGLCLGFRLAKKYNLRRIFIVAPFTKIINQTVKRLRESIVLENENSFHAVAEHHHNADYLKDNPDGDSKSAKLHTTHWNSPIICTTAVQFFETCASNHPSKLRKFNQIAGSVIIIDESDACVQLKYIRQCMKWLKILEDVFGCKVIFMSGSNVKFWKIEALKIDGVNPKCVVSRKTRKMMDKQEDHRISYSSLGTVNFDQLMDQICSKIGPRIVVLNTINNAVVLTSLIEKKYGRKSVEQLSTVFSPNDFDNAYDRILKRLADPNDNDWTLVCTSCVESGVNFSFRNGFRERCGIRSFLQSSGRVNRDDEYSDSFMYDFVLNDAAMTSNPQFSQSASIFGEFLSSNKIHDKYCTEFVKEEIRRANKTRRLSVIEKYEDNWNFFELNEKFNIIDSATITVISSEETKNKILDGKILYLTDRDILRNSIRIRIDENMRVKKGYIPFIDTISAEAINSNREDIHHVKQDIYVWTGPYDNDLYGYMKPFMI
jgi:CRISPR-associated endonuclease/helicase Cas3